MHPLLSKTARVGIWYVALCALALWLAQHYQLAQCTDSRDAAIRELSRADEPAEVLFLGSSQTARGLIPAVFDARMSELSGVPIRSVNLAPFGAGRHIGFLTLARWLESHPAPSVVAVEVGVTSDLIEFPHSMLTRYMDAGDCARALRIAPYRARDAREFARRRKSPPLIDPLGIFSRLDRRALHAELALEVLGRGPEDCVRALFDRIATRGESWYWKPKVPGFAAEVRAQVDERGFFRVAPDSAVGLEGKKRVEQRNREMSYEAALAQRPAEDDEPFASPERYLPAKTYALRIAELCRARGVRLVFVEQLNYRGKPLRPSQREFYGSLAELFEPDRSVLFRDESFQDAGHLSVQGAEFLSRSLAEWLCRQE